MPKEAAPLSAPTQAVNTTSEVVSNNSDVFSLMGSFDNGDFINDKIAKIYSCYLQLQQK